jgi:hypothetical protein
MSHDRAIAPTMKPSFSSFPWLSVIYIGIAYGLLGWRISGLAAFWLIDAWLMTVVLIFILIWRGRFVMRLVRMGPRSLVLIFLLSMTLTLALSYPEPFGLSLILLLTVLLGRLELQTNGWGRKITLTILSVVAGGTMLGGWFLGRDPSVNEVFHQLPRWLQLVFGQA